MISGLAQGCIYSLVALGFVLIYKTTGVINLAQGEMMMAGAYIYYTLLTALELPFPVAFVTTLLAAGILGALIERLIMHRLVGEPVFVLLMVTAGLAVVIRAGVGMIFSHNIFPVPTPLAGRSYALGDVTIAAVKGWACLVTLVLTTVLFAFFRITRLGIAMRAVAQNRYAAQLMGVSVRRMFTFTWALAAIVAAVGGMLLADITYLHTNMGFIGLRAMPAAVLGGLTSIPGVLVGGLIIGLVESLIGVSLGGGLKEVSAYVVLLAVLLLRPSGLFGTAETKRV
ncbi:MAG: branched-chain amino acid ABC transporter permease [Promethearchaeota archaeon]